MTMAPETLRVTAIGFALLTVALLALAAREWWGTETADQPEPARRSGWHGALILFLVSLGLVGAVLVTAESMGWSRDRAMWVGTGGFLAVLTLARPWWFWENYRARWLRGVIGDEATAVIYLLFAGVCLWIGLTTNWTFGRR